MSGQFAWENIIDYETLNMLNEYYGIDSPNISLPSLIKGVITELKLSPNQASNINLGHVLLCAYQRLQLHPDFYDGLCILINLLEQGLYSELVHWYQKQVK